MVIRLDENYNAMTSTALLGYVGETNARPVSVEGMEIDGADRYVLTIDYGDGTVYEVDITGGTWTPTADILRSAQTISCQIAATTAAENAKKSATAAGLSADTATQAAERAETAQASAETSATQADTARQGAETARQQAVTAQNAAKISAAQASTAAQQTEADKTITAGYAKTAKTCADSTAADRQAVQEMATQVTADKTTVAENAAKAAEDRTAAETAAQTAQSIADSLPEDYVTAVGKIAENTAEISAVKLTDKELQRRVNALYDIGQGVTHKFETDSETAYQKVVPTGAKLMSVKSIGGHSEVIDGEIVSAGVTEVVEQGKNLWDEVWGVGSINASSGNDEGSKEAIYSKNYTPIIPNSTYIFVYAGSAKFENVKTRFYDYNKNYIGYNDKDGQTVYPNKKFITPSDTFYVRFTLPPSYGNAYKNDIALIAGSSGAYAPYHSNVYPIPEAIKALPGYGIEGNVTDYEAKTYTQNNAIDGTEVKALDTPIITDISSLIPDDFLRNLTVEAGGSVTFKNSNGDNYRIPVPSEEEYIVKLSEVGGTT